MSTFSSHPVRARACANIALIKYWGKRSDGALNLPATSSLSLTLADLQTITEVGVSADLEAHQVVLNDAPVDDLRVCAFLDHIRMLAGGDSPYASVLSSNNFPTAAGLASSASGFAALTLAATRAYGLDLSSDALSALARMGSGSAPRSLWGGFCVMHKGAREDGLDAVAAPLLEASQWPLEVVIAITEQGAKSVSSRQGMNHTMATSPYYGAWVSHNESQLEAAKQAVLSQDFERLADLSEASALQMHASAMAAEPGVLYWHAATVACLHAIRDLRAAGCGVFFTIDAGPQVKAICLPGASAPIVEALTSIPGVVGVRHSQLGLGAEVL
ncbi:MAG TPA: diphosphomevalonate decarboxylase [Wenzhouxiangella sp.]